MVSNKEFLEEFKTSFEEMRSRLGFTVTFEELDRIFFLEDFVLQAGFVSTKLSRMLCSRIVDTFNNWAARCQQWLMPNPSSIVAYNEAQAFSDEDKQAIQIVMTRFWHSRRKTI